MNSLCHRSFLLLGALAACCLAVNVRGQSYVNYEAKQTSPVRLSPDGSRLFAVNTPDNRLSVFDVTSPHNPILIAEIPVGLDPVSVHPLNNDEAWVVNEVSDSVSIVSVSSHAVIETLSVPDEPADVVFANGRAFVTAARKNRIAVFDIATRAAITSIPVLGENPRALCVNSNGTRVYAAFALSGNRTTLVPPDSAPPQTTTGTPPMRAGLPAPPQVSLIVDATDPAWAPSVIKYSIPDNDVVEIDTTTLAVTRYFPRVGTVNFAIAVRPGSGDLFVANTDARNLTHFEPALRSAFITNQVSRIDINSGAVTRYDLNPSFNYATFPSLADKTNALAQPTAIAFWPGGTAYFVAAFGSDRIAVVSADSGQVTTRVDLNPAAPGSLADPRTKRGPRGLALKPTALYVLNRLANTLTVIDAINPRVLREIPVGSHDPTPAVVRQGRGFLYDAKLSGNGTVSCASCHIDGEMDMLAWDLGDPQGNLDTVSAKVSGSSLLIPGGLSSNFVFHPMKGPMTTQTLRGLAGLDPLHWRGDRADFSHFNGAFDSLLGGLMLSAADMQAYRDFINTIRYQPNPNQKLDRTLPATFGDGDPVAGRNAYLNTNYQGSGALGLKCNTCHAIPNGTDKSFTPAAALQESQTFKVPQLRATYQKMRFTNTPGAESLLGFGLVHDGQDPSLFAFLSRPVFGTFAPDPIVKRNLSAFVQCFDTGTAPAVGYARTITAANSASPAVTTDWNLLESQAAGLTNIDLVVKAVISGQRHGFLYQPALGLYKSDTTNLISMNRAQLHATVTARTPMTLLGVPPGSGTRLGIDRNLDGILDGDAPRPILQVNAGGSTAVISWPLVNNSVSNGTSFLLEKTAALPPVNWSPDTSLRGVSTGNISVTNSLSTSNLFFRLREL